MSKLSFRARALDATKPMPVFRCDDLPDDLHEYASINRAVPQMPTGMEKEEESEHHLQRAISAQQVYGEKRDSMVIPVPEGESDIGYYESLYPGDFKMPKQLIHLQPFSLDAEQPDYDLDSEDDTFVNKLKKKLEITALQFEEMVDRLEKGSGQQLVSLQEAKLLLKEDDDLIKEVFDYWSRKRKGSKKGYLGVGVKQEKRDGSSTSDPYVAFRRRTEKMQTRKNRKNDEASYEKMLKLRRDLSRAVTVLEMIKRREKSKRELLHLTLEIVEKRNTLPDFGSEVIAEALAQQALAKPVYTIPILPLPSNNQYHLDTHKDYKKPEKMEVVRTKRKYEKKPKVPPLVAAQHSGPSVFNPKDLNQYDFPSSEDEAFSQIHSGSSEAEEENDPDGCYAFRRKAGCQYYTCRADQSGGSWPWVCPSEGGTGDRRFRYCLTSLMSPRRCVGLARRRVGRGGRVLLDRAHTDLDGIFHSLDSDPEPEPQQLTAASSSSSWSSSSPVPAPSCPTLRNPNASTSETNTSDPAGTLRPPSNSSSAPVAASSSSVVDLGQILLNIKTCRWRHFRPRTLSHHPVGGREPGGRGFRGFGRSGIGARNQASGIGASNQSRAGPPPTPVNVFTAEQYQQHQEQLALMQKQQLEQVQQQQQANSTNTQGLLSTTLDQASAQFAASALVNTDQLLAFSAKEDLVLAGGVNGVLPPTGVFKGLHLPSPTPASHHHHHHNNQSTTAAAPPTFLQPSSNSAPPFYSTSVATTPTSLSSVAHNSSAAALGLLGCSNPAATASAATQVLIGNNLRLSMSPSSVTAAGLAGRHHHHHHPPHRALGNVPPSALKLATSHNLQMPKVVSAAPAMDSRDNNNHDQDTPSLNSIADNTVAMEVT